MSERDDDPDDLDGDLTTAERLRRRRRGGGLRVPSDTVPRGSAAPRVGAPAPEEPGLAASIAYSFAETGPLPRMGTGPIETLDGTTAPRMSAQLQIPAAAIEALEAELAARERAAAGADFAASPGEDGPLAPEAATTFPGLYAAEVQAVADESVEPELVVPEVIEEDSFETRTREMAAVDLEALGLSWPEERPPSPRADEARPSLSAMTVPTMVIDPELLGEASPASSSPSFAAVSQAPVEAAPDAADAADTRAAAVAPLIVYPSRGGRGGSTTAPPPLAAASAAHAPVDEALGRTAPAIAEASPASGEVVAAMPALPALEVDVDLDSDSPADADSPGASGPIAGASAAPSAPVDPDAGWSLPHELTVPRRATVALDVTDLEELVEELRGGDPDATAPPRGAAREDAGAREVASDAPVAVPRRREESLPLFDGEVRDLAGPEPAVTAPVPVVPDPSLARGGRDSSGEIVVSLDDESLEERTPTPLATQPSRRPSTIPPPFAGPSVSNPAVAVAALGGATPVPGGPAAAGPPAAVPPAPPGPKAMPPAPPARRVSRPEPVVAPRPAPAEERKPARGRQWFQEVFDEDYLRTLPFLTSQATRAEAEFVISALGVSAGGRVLDVGCGYGRHAMELAARGFQVVGIDLSTSLLARGAEVAAQRGLELELVRRDMRELEYDGEFDGAYCLFSTFGYFDDETNKKTASNIARALRPGGKVVIEILNRDYLIADLPTRVWWEGEGCVVLEEVELNYFSSRLKVNRSLVFEDGRQVEQELSVRAYSLHEVGRLMQAAGFRVLEVSGGFHTRGRFFGNQSRQIIVVAERRDAPPP